MQDEYIDKILFRSKKGYIIYNFIKPLQPKTPYNKKEICKIFSQKHAITIMDEEPKTGPYDFLIKWADTRKKI